jgi:APA family basic amino acid/polyamine antiporter
MIGQGVFLLASDMSREVGSMTMVMAAWLIGGTVALFGTLCFTELGAAMPEAGGAYVYLRRGLGPVWGFLHGWTSAMIMRPASAATIAAGLLRFATFLLPVLTGLGLAGRKMRMTWGISVATSRGMGAQTRDQ